MTVRTFEDILASIKSRIADVSNLDTSEGSYTDTVIRAAAMEIASDYFDQEAMLPIAFVDETSGIYIDKRAAEYGLTRKNGTRAVASVTFSGRDGASVPAGTAVQTREGLVFLTDTAVMVASGSATAAVTAENTGSVYNVEAGAITTLQNSVGVVVQSSTAAIGGTDDETDEALVERLYAIWRKPATSGNANQYEAWALEVDGIGGAKVWPTWNGGGTVAAAVQTEASTTKQEVQAQFRQLLDTYCKEIAFKMQTVVYNRIAYMLLSIPGVTDFTDLTVNGGKSNLTLADNAVPVLGTVSIS